MTGLGRTAFVLLLIALIPAMAAADKILIYMDLEQFDHLRAYVVAYWALEKGSFPMTMMAAKWV